jgi:outer membrane protein assembly factor BamB
MRIAPDLFQGDSGRGRRIIRLIVSAALSVTMLAVSAAAASASSPGSAPKPRPSWYPQVLYNGQNRANPKETILKASNVSTLTNLWTSSTGFLTPFAAPVVDQGLVFQSEYACCPAPSEVDAFDATTGALRWTFPTSTSVTASPAVSGGVVYAGDYDGTLYAIDEASGSLLWSGTTGGQFFDPNFITVSGKYVFTGTVTAPAGFGDGALAIWNASGCGASTCSPLWTATIAGGVQGGPAVSGKMVFVASSPGTLDAFRIAGCRTPPCSPVWQGTYDAGGGGNTFGSLAVAGTTVYVSNGSGAQVAAFQTGGCGAPQCLPAWTYDAAQVDNEALAVVNGTLYAGAIGGLAAFPATCPLGSVCEPTWQDVDASQAHILVANGAVFGTFGSTAFADDATTGARLWTAGLPSNPQQGPAVANGKVYVADTFANEVLAYALPA